MKAAIDIGSNTVRMLVSDVCCRQVVSRQYFRQVTRLAGGYNPIEGLSVKARERTLLALEKFARELDGTNLSAVRTVATEAVRRAVNGPQFIADILARTGLVVEIIDGDEEALLSSAGALSALQPPPSVALIFDIGGGSTEFIVIQGGVCLWQKSYALGVVSLAETRNPRIEIDRVMTLLAEDLRSAGLLQLVASESCELVGTAGTVTTLAAVDLAMEEYDWQRVNNHVMPLSTLLSLSRRLLPLSPIEREHIVGVEEGRGDLITHGLAIVLSILDLLHKDSLRVSDFGLLEGVFLSMP